MQYTSDQQLLFTAYSHGIRKTLGAFGTVIGDCEAHLQ
jgi:hypothetical protein